MGSGDADIIEMYLWGWYRIDIRIKGSIIRNQEEIESIIDGRNK